MDKQKVCSKCGGTSFKIGKLFGVAAVHSLDARTGVGGSDLLVEFCDACGNVEGITVKNPENIK